MFEVRKKLWNFILDRQHLHFLHQLTISAHFISKSISLYPRLSTPKIWKRSPCFSNSSKGICVSIKKLDKDDNYVSDDTKHEKEPYFNSEKVEKNFDNSDKCAEVESFVRLTRNTFGDTLPKDYLSTEEYKVYERLFGSPLRETTLSDLKILPKSDNRLSHKAQSIFLREAQDNRINKVTDGLLEDEPRNTSEINDKALDVTPLNERENGNVCRLQTTNLNFDYVAQNQRELNLITRLCRDMVSNDSNAKEESKLMNKERAKVTNLEQDLEQEEEDEENEITDNLQDQDLFISSDINRAHPHTITAQSRPNPSTVHLPYKTFLSRVTELLTRTNPTHLQQTAEKVFGGVNLPFSVSVPISMNNIPQRSIGLLASQHRMSEIEADAYISVIMPGAYASIMNILVEVRKRLGQGWLREILLKDYANGPRVLDAGSGGAGILAWKRVIEAEWQTMKDDGIVKDETFKFDKSSVVTGSDSLRHRVSKLLENTTFLPRLPDYIHADQSDRDTDGVYLKGRKIFDVVIAPYLLLAQKEEYKRRNLIKNLWTLVNPRGGVLIIMEKGIPRGFEAIAEARSFVLNSFVASPGINFIENDVCSSEHEQYRFTQEEGMIIAPCPNHKQCPMYLNSGISRGRKDFCHFSQRYIRPPFLQKILGAKARNHEDIKFSYVAFQRGVNVRKNSSLVLNGDEATLQSFEGFEHHDLPESHQENDSVRSDVKFSSFSLPRIILKPLKRHGHVTLDVCTPSGQLERWTVPKSFSKTAYRDARKSKWGDLWALGAKTRVKKNTRLGEVIDVRVKKTKSILQRVKVKKYDVIIGKDGFQGFKRASKPLVDKNERRTKGGRLFKESRPIGADDF